MNCILYILMSVNAVYYASSIIDPVTRVKLLPEIVTNLVEDDKHFFYNYSNNQNSDFKLSDLTDVYLLSNEKISSQFVISAIFKINDMSKQWCLFSIRKEGFVMMSMCFLPVDADSTNIILHVGNNTAEKSESALLPNRITNKWSNITVQVLNNEVTFSLNCKCIAVNEVDNLWPSITMTEDMDLILAKSSASLQLYIEEIALYPSGNNDTMKSICGVELGDLSPDFLTSDDKAECSCSDEILSSFVMRNTNLKGDKGEKGSPGNKGLQGNTGPKGEKGEKGKKGVQGPQGPMGQDGGLGKPGSDGIPGKHGAKGAKGDTGPPGPRYVLTEEEKNASIIRVPGLQGEKGPIGPSGEKGESGKKGDMGNIGPRGPPGDLGPPGLRGNQGDKGQKGQTGKDGIPGIRGPPGDKGDTGEKGHRGSPGMPGAPAKLSSILKDEISPEEKVRIINKLRGETGDKGNTGEKGMKGDQGLIGIRGPPGKDGKDGLVGKTGDKGEKGESGTEGASGTKGDKGEPGPAGTVPASEIALLKGAKGDIGLPGSTGPPGPTGEKGEKGDIGPTGPKGDTGEPGVIGIPGPIGPPGLNGTVGEKGQKGESAPVLDIRELKGEKGDMGLTDIGRMGRPGPVGPPGRKGDQGIRGPQGFKGEPGLKGEIGQPGVAVIGEKGEKGDSCSKDYNHILADINDEDAFYPASTFVYVSIKGLKKATHLIPIGTIVYVIQERILLIKSKHREWSLIKTIPLTDLTSRSLVYPMPKPQPARPSIPFSISTSTTTRRPYVYNNISDSERRRKNIRLIALNEPYAGTGKYNKLKEDADGLCHVQSALLQRKGDFKAFRSNKLQFLRGIVPKEDWDLPVVNVLEQPLFDSWRNIFNGSGAVIRKGSNILSFNYHNVLHSDDIWKDKIIWHGSTWAGKRNENCHDWTSDSPTHYGTGSSLANNLLLGQEFFTCDKQLILLCVEVDIKS